MSTPVNASSRAIHKISMTDPFQWFVFTYHFKLTEIACPYSFKINYSTSGNMYVSGSVDGSIKIWDGISNKCSLSFNRAHEGEEICSALFSKNGKVALLSLI